MLGYKDVQGYLEIALTNLDYDPLPLFDPGPGSDLVTQDQTPNTMVIISLTGGPGMDSEEVFDQASIQVRTIGPQQDYDGAEKLAQDIDRALVALDHSQSINGKWVLSVIRTGGAPALLLQDDGDRFHFTCNYVWEVQY
jgi:Bacteriophage minor capsid protein